MGAIVGHPYEALFALAMTTGMRPSEYLALTWADINLVQGTVSVSRTLEWKKGGWQFAETKRSRSRRVIKLQAWVIGLLVKYRQGFDPQAVNGHAQRVRALHLQDQVNQLSDDGHTSHFLIVLSKGVDSSLIFHPSSFQLKGSGIHATCFQALIL